MQIAKEKWQSILKLENGVHQISARILWSVQIKLYVLVVMQITLKASAWKDIKVSFAVIVHLIIQRKNSSSAECALSALEILYRQLL